MPRCIMESSFRGLVQLGFYISEYDLTIVPDDVCDKDKLYR